MSKILSVAKIGKNALSNDPNDFIFHSGFNTFKIIKVIEKTVTLTATTVDQTFTESHELGFVPLVRGFAKQDGIDVVFSANSENISGWHVTDTALTTGIKFNYIASNNNDIIINFDNNDVSDIDVTVKLFCLEGIYSTSPPANNGSPAGPRIVVAKDGYNAKTETDPRNLKFSSQYGTLKYSTKLEQTVLLDGSTNQEAHVSITHDFGYYLYLEAYVKVYIGSSGADYEPVPFYGAGASVLYDAQFTITENTIELYTKIDGVSYDIWNFDFVLFLYKNNLNF